MGIVLGVIGQGIRAIIGIKKKYDKENREFNDWFDSKQLVFSLIIGGVAGALGVILIDIETLNRQTLLTLITIGYSGTDFIEGFINRSLR